MPTLLRLLPCSFALGLAATLAPSPCRAVELTPYLFADLGRSESSPGFRGGWGGGLRHDSGWGLEFQYSHGREIEVWTHTYLVQPDGLVLVNSSREVDETRVMDYSISRQFSWQDGRWALDLRLGRYRLDSSLLGLSSHFWGNSAGLSLERRLSAQLSLGIDLQQLRLPRDDVLRPALRLSWSFRP